jgi:Flp pilus assembly pilin Flp
MFRPHRIRSFVAAEAGLATIEYILGAAVVLGTLVIGVQAWNNGLVSRLQALVTQMGAVR